MLRVYQVDVFTKKALEGNPAAVVPKGAALTPARMQAIAREMNLSETAFLMPSSRADIKIRYFTPAGEVALCGHATIASFAVLNDEGILDGGRAYVETRAGVLPVDVENGMAAGTRVWLGMDDAAWTAPTISALTVARVMGVPVGWVAQSMPLRVSKGDTLFVPLAARAQLTKVELVPARWTKLARSTGLKRVCAFKLKDERGTRWECRYFAPGVGVWEDPVTGVAHGRIAQFLLAEGRIGLGATGAGEQGGGLGRPGVVYTRVSDDRKKTRVFIGGDSVIALRGVLSSQ